MQTEALEVWALCTDEEMDRVQDSSTTVFRDEAFWCFRRLVRRLLTVDCLTALNNLV